MATEESDKHLEDFWLSFKDSIYSYLDESQKRHINNTSVKLNGLKANEQYHKILKIEQTIYEYLEKMSKYFVANDMDYQASILKTNIKRWNKLSSSIYKEIDILEEEDYNLNIGFDILDIYLKCARKNKTALKDLICLYAQNPSNSYLILIVNQAIREENYGVIEKLRPYINIKKFLKHDSYYHNDLTKLHQVKIRKLINHLEPR